MHRRLPAAALAAGAALALAACSDGSPGPSGGGAATPSPTSISSAAFPGKTPEQILQAATTAARSAKSLRVKGSVVEAGDTITMDVLADTRGNSTGSLKVLGGTLDLRVDGKQVYLRGDKAFWKKNAPEAAELLTGAWMKTSTKNKDFAEFIKLGQPQTYFDDKLAPRGSLSVIAGRPVDGVPTLGLRDRGAGPGSATIYVATEGEPYPLLVVSGEEGETPLTFTDWNAPVTVKAPAGAIAVDG